MKKLTAVVIAIFIAGCATEPAIQSGPDAEKTFDGLVRIDNSRFAGAWIDPDVDLKQYNKIIPGGAEFQFRSVQKMSASAARRANEREFWISDSNKQRLIDTVTEVFDEELQKSEHFTVTDEPGPDALIIVGGLARHRVAGSAGGRRKIRGLVAIGRRSDPGHRTARLAEQRSHLPRRRTTRSRECRQPDDSCQHGHDVGRGAPLGAALGGPPARRSGFHTRMRIDRFPPVVW